MRTGFSLAIVVTKKGTIPYAVASVRYFLEQCGHSHLVLRGDGENALQSFLRASKEAVSGTIKVDIQATPPGSHASIGGAEKFHDTLASQVRTLIHRVESKSGVVIAPTATLFPWAIRHANYQMTRFHLRTQWCVISYI